MVCSLEAVCNIFGKRYYMDDFAPEDAIHKLATDEPITMEEFLRLFAAILVEQDHLEHKMLYQAASEANPN
jgi:hypothetical protein